MVPTWRGEQIGEDLEQHWFEEVLTLIVQAPPMPLAPPLSPQQRFIKAYKDLEFAVAMGYAESFGRGEPCLSSVLDALTDLLSATGSKETWRLGLLTRSYEKHIHEERRDEK